MEYRILLKKFRELDIDRNAVGLSCNGNDIAYFCTPIGAEIIGWTGVDGIHYCFIPSSDENMVFAISPMPCGKHHAEPVAYSFTDFMRLILSCGNSYPLEQISWVSESDFISLLESDSKIFVNGKTEALNKIQSTFGIEKLTESYRYVKSIQEHFDYSTIPYSDEYYDVTGLERAQTLFDH